MSPGLGASPLEMPATKSPRLSVLHRLRTLGKSGGNCPAKRKTTSAFRQTYYRPRGKKKEGAIAGGVGGAKKPGPVPGPKEATMVEEKGQSAHVASPQGRSRGMNGEPSTITRGHNRGGGTR